MPTDSQPVETDYTNIVIETVTKQLYIDKTDLVKFLKKLYKDRSISSNDFCKTLGQDLGLVPKVCTDRALMQIY
jgi:hypothetical protein